MGLCHRPKPTPEPITILNTTRATIPTGIEAQVDPMHPMLSGENDKINKGVKLISVNRLRVGEARRNFVLPAHIISKDFGCSFSKGFKDGRRRPHVGRSPENDSVGPI